MADYIFEIDWDGDSSYGNANSDCTGNLLEVETRRGRDYASQLTGRASPGRLVATLKNLTGLYSSYNTSSAIYGLILPGRRVRLRTTAPTAVILWTGFLNTIIPAGEITSFPSVTIDAIGSLNQIAEKKVYPEHQTSQLSGTIIGVILDAAGWAAGARSLDAGQTTVDTWFVDGPDALNAIRDIEDTELGFFYESEEGDLVFEDRHHRLKTPHTVSQATFSDSAALTYAGIEQQDPLPDIYNEVFVSIQKYTIAGASAILWTLSGETPTIEPGGTVAYWAEYPNFDLDIENGAFVSVWDTPVEGVDITQTGASGITIVASKFANSMKIEITNDDAANVATLTLVQAKGTKVTKNSPVRISAEDAASQLAYGEKTYQLPAKWLQNTNIGTDYTKYLVSRYKDLVPLILLEYYAHRDATAMTQALTRNVSDRITIVATGDRTRLGLNGDFFIEAISHIIADGGKSHRVVYELSDASGDAGYWTLGVSALGIETKLAY